MIEVGMAEDPEYTKRAMEFTLNFDDIMHLPDLELAEVLASMPGRLIGFAIHQAPEEIKKRFMEKAQPRVYAEIKEALEMSNVSLAMIGSGQMKMIETARKLEKKGLVKAKKIPLRAQ